MTSTSQAEAPVNGIPHPNAESPYQAFDHLHLWVTNAKQAASWYILRLGFQNVAYRGLETGSRSVCTHVVKQHDIVIAFSSPLNPAASELTDRIAVTGDAVKDVAFTVTDCRAVYEAAIGRGAESVEAPVEVSDEHGRVVLSTIRTYGDTTHTFVERKEYNGPFLPGYVRRDTVDPLSSLVAIPNLLRIDHVVGNQADLQMMPTVEWYEKTLGFHRFWSVDDKQIHTEYSSLRSVVMADPTEKIKMPINEPANGKRKSQIQEYVDYHGGAGVQHVALFVDDIIFALRTLRSRGMEFLTVPASYYADVRARLAKSTLKVAESLDVLQELNILIDFDDSGYLLQIFTKPVEDRPTLFYEVIQRRGHQGFGAGNFKALFEAIEREQAQRGNLEN